MTPSLGRAIAVTLLLACLPQQVCGQVFAPAFQPSKPQIAELSTAGARLWERSIRFARDGQPTEAVAALRQVIDNHAQEMVPAGVYRLGTETWERFIPADAAAQELIFSWKETSPATAEQYHKLYHAAAERSLTAAETQHSLAALEKGLRTHAACDTAGEAWLRYGDLALERGFYQTARHAYEQLHPVTIAARKNDFTNAGSELWLPFRASTFDVAWNKLGPQLVEVVRAADKQKGARASAGKALARLALVSFLAGENSRGEIEWELLKRLAPAETGHLAGRTGNLVEILAEVKRSNRGHGSKPAFAPTAFEDQPRWTIQLPSVATANDVLGTGRTRPADDGQQTLAYFPLVANGQVCVRADEVKESHVTAYDLQTGAHIWRFSEPLSPPERNAAKVMLGLPRFTLTAQRGTLFAKLGSSVTLPHARHADSLRPQDQGFLVGLDVASEGRPREGFPLYPESTEWSFEGPPLVDEGRLIVAMSKREGNRRQAYVACYETLTVPVDTARGQRDERHRGRLLWRTMIATADTIGGGQFDEISHTLISRHEDTIFISTNLGVVAAVSTHDGKMRWQVRYPRLPRSAETNAKGENCFFRDLTPPIVHRGRVIFAPADAPRVFALHESTGLPAWATSPETGDKIVHLLGAHGEQLLAAGDQLHWLDIFTGEVQGSFPAASDPSRVTHGRGFLASNTVYWPTRDAIFVLPAEFVPAPQPIQIDLKSRGISGGNVVPFTDGLLIAGVDRLTALFASEAKVQRNPGIKRRPETE